MNKLHPTVIELLAEIEAYRALSGEDRTAFGRNAMNDGHFITRVEHGRLPTFRTIDRIQKYIRRRTKAVG